VAHLHLTRARRDVEGGSAIQHEGLGGLAALLRRSPGRSGRDRRDCRAPLHSWGFYFRLSRLGETWSCGAASDPEDTLRAVAGTGAGVGSSR